MYFMDVVRTLVATGFALILLQGIVSGSRYFPRTWVNICDKSITLAPSLGAGRPAVLVQLKCNIPKSDKVRWRLNDLRRWTIDKSINQYTTPVNRTVLYNITVTCQVGANISLPWPMKVAGLIELHVSYCLLLDRYGNYMDGVDSKIANDMKVLEIRHSTWVLNKTNRILESSGDSLNLTSDFDCGQDSSLETIITSNVSDTVVDNLDEMLDSMPGTEKPKEGNSKLFEVTGDLTLGPARPEDRLINDTTKVVSDESNLKKDDKNNETTTMTPEEDVQVTPKQTQQAEIDYINLIKQILKTGSTCTFKKLKHFDESIAQVTPLHHFEFLVYGSEYPVLEFMNYSRIGLKELPKEFSEWRIYFPRLTLLDLTYNYLSELKLANFPATHGTGDVVFNLRHNNFTSISMELLQSWAAVDQVVVDIRDNPIHCGCDLASLLPSLEDESTFEGQLAPYRYVRNLRCYTPESLKGRQLYELTTDSLQCIVQKQQDNTVVIVLGVLLCILIATILMILKFKIEIRILLYTRLHVRLPCDADIHRNNKTFDAFVSYSNEDAAWVFENLLKFLENPQNQEAGHIANGTKTNKKDASSGARSFRLCVHQRDFIPGKTILDNIVDCIESSRHTIIVLSPRFLKSQWSMEELRQAYRQSLVEKSRHLIIILLEKVSKEDMDPLVRRCCKTFTYLDAADSLFKDRLVFSLTTKTKSKTGNPRLPPTENSTSRPGYQAGVKGQSHQNIYDKLEIPCSPHTYDNKAYFSSSSSSIKKNDSNSNYKSNNNYNNSNNYSSFPTNRPPDPLRELSNLSTSSTSGLTKH